MIGNNIITKVLTPATDFRLTTKEHVRDDLNITDGSDDAFLDRLIVQESTSVASYCNRVFAMQTYRDTWRWERGNNLVAVRNRNPLLSVRMVPLLSISSIIERGVMLTEDVDFEVDYERGYIYRLNDCDEQRQWPAVKIVVIYVAGFTLPTQGANGENFTLPADVEQAVIRMVKARYIARDRDPNMKSQTVPGVLETTFWIPNSDTGNMPPEIADILDNYRVPAIA